MLNKQLEKKGANAHLARKAGERMATHEELISVGSFVEKFKNPFRDYYNYGFKNLNDYLTGNSTIAKDFNRLQNIMADYFEWSASKDMKKVIFISQDSQAMNINPIHRLFRFCSSSSVFNMGMLFHTLLALDSRFILDDEYYWTLKANNVSDCIKDFISKLPIDKEIKKDLLEYTNPNSERRLEDVLKIAKKNRLSVAQIKKIETVLSLDVVKLVEKCIEELDIDDESKRTKLLAYADKHQKFKGLLKLAKELRLSENQIQRIEETTQFKRVQIRECINSFGIRKDIKKELLACLSDNPEPKLNTLIKEIRKCGIPEDKVDELVTIIYSSAEELFAAVEKMNVMDKALLRKELSKTVCLFHLNSTIEKRVINTIRDGDNVFATLRECNLSDEQLYRLIETVEACTYRIYKRFEEKMHPLEMELTKLIKNFHLSQSNEDALLQVLDNRQLLLDRARENNLSEDQIGQIKKVFEENRIRLMTSDLISILEYGKSSESAKAPVSKTVNNRLNLLAQMGILRNVRETEKDNSRWELAQLNAEVFLEGGKEINPNFEKHFIEAIDFFSKYLYLGEIGSFILDKLLAEYESPFRFKHEYFMHAANDYALIDLLHAIEYKKWCLISYKHGIADFHTKLLCYPLQIRISSTNGREYLMFYNPFKRSYSSMRVEFIEDIYYLSDDYVRTISGIKDIDFDLDIKNSLSGLKYCWGVSTSVVQENNALAAPSPQIFYLKIACKEDEFYILNRLQRESRIGKIKYSKEKEYIEFVIKVNDYHEIMPWVRSFYSRILDCQSSDEKALQFIRNDIEKMNNGQATEVFGTSEISENNNIWNVSGDIDMGETAKEHEELFNELFSVYCFITSEVVSILYSNINVSQWLEDDILYVIKLTLKKYSHIIGQKTALLLPNDILGMIIEQGFLTEGVVQLSNQHMEPQTVENHKEPNEIRILNCVPKYYSLGNTSFYKSVIPFSNIEIRWIKTMLEDEKVSMFMDETEIQYIQSIIDHYGQYVSFPSNAVCYFDRYKPNDTFGMVARQTIHMLIDSISEKKKVIINYQTMNGKAKSGKYCPINITYSKRNDSFQGYFLSEEDNLIYIFNLSKVSSIKSTTQVFDEEKVSKAYQEYLKSNEQSVEIIFGEGKNLVDRLLSEFSPWKKRCTYDREQNQYNLCIFYHKGDEVELVIRLLGYGSAIQFKNQELEIYDLYMARISRQKDLFKETERAAYISEYENGRI